MAVGGAGQPPVVTALQHSDLQLAIVESPSLELVALKYVDVAKQKSQHTPFRLFSPQLLADLHCPPLLVLKHYFHDACAHLQGRLAHTAELFETLKAKLKLVHY